MVYEISLKHTTPLTILGFLDVFSICYINLASLRVVFFGINTTILLCYAYTKQLNELDQTLSQASYQMKTRLINKLNYISKLWHFMQMHTNIIRNLITINDEVLSSSFFFAALGNVSINIYMITLIFYKESALLNKMIISFAIILQVINFYGATLALAEIAKKLYQSTCHFHSIQLHLGSYLIDFKMKTMKYYELMHTHNQYYLTIGAIGQITKYNMFRVCLFKPGFLQISLTIVLFRKSCKDFFRPKHFDNYMS